MSLQECPRFYLSANIYKEKNSIQKIFVRTYLLTQQLPSYNDSLTCKHGGYMLNVNILQPDDWMLNLISATVLFPQKESFVSHPHFSPRRSINGRELLDCVRGGGGILSIS